MLDLGGKGTVMLEGKGVDGGAQLVELVQRWDLKPANQLLGG